MERVIIRRHPSSLEIDTPPPARVSWACPNNDDSELDSKDVLCSVIVNWITDDYELRHGKRYINYK